MNKGFRLGADSYIKTMRKIVIPWMDRVAKKHGRPYVFQQDGAPAHTAKRTVDFFNRAGVPFWGPKMWPPSSPDCSPLDYSIWSHVERKACKGRHSSITALKRSVNRVWNRIDKPYVRKVCGRFRSRLMRVIATDGGHFE